MSEDSGIRELAGRYRLITPLGRRVMRGWDLHLRQVVAIRLFSPQDDPDLFVERAGVLTDLSHPGLVRVLDAGVAEDEPFLVQEFIAGTTLRTRLADGVLTEDEVTELGTTLGKALAYAHSRGVTHRDVHPGNILLGPSQEPYLTDIGIAETTTPSYTSPEQATGNEPTAASDVYSLGLVLLECLTGRTEYPGNDPAMVPARLTRRPKIAPELPHAAALEAMTSTNPDDRPDAATCVDLLRGSSAKSRVQTRTVLVAAVAAAVVATGLALALNTSRQQPLVEPREASVDQPQQTETVTVRATPTATGTTTPTETQRSVSQTPTGQQRAVIQDQPVVLLPPIGTPETTVQRYPLGTYRLPQAHQEAGENTARP